MTKSELKTGMIVVLADGKEYMVFKDVSHSGDTATDVLVAINGSSNWTNLDNYNEDMTTKKEAYKDLNINKVIQTPHPYALITPYYRKELNKVLWTRKKQYTYAQLREILGEEFEVVG